MMPVDYVLVGAAILALPGFYLMLARRIRSFGQWHDQRSEREVILGILWALHASTVAFTVIVVRVFTLPVYSELRLGLLAVMIGTLLMVGILTLLWWPQR